MGYIFSNGKYYTNGKVKAQMEWENYECVLIDVLKYVQFRGLVSDVTSAVRLVHKSD